MKNKIYRVSRYAFLSVLLFLPLFFTNSVMGSQMNNTGCLVYTSRGKDIRGINLTTLDPLVIHEGAHNGVSIDYVTKISSDRVLFQECDGLRTPNCLIKEFNLLTGTIKTLHPGRMPSSIPESDSYSFYGKSKNDKKEWLFLSRMDETDGIEKIAKAPPKVMLPNRISFSIQSPAVPISSDEVVFIGEAQKLLTYSISKKRVKETLFRQKSPRVWLEKTQELIAWDWETKSFYKIDFKKGTSTKFSLLKDVYSGLVYIQEYDTLIYSKSRSHLMLREITDILAHNLGTKKRITLLPGTISTGVWWACPSVSKIK